MLGIEGLPGRGIIVASWVGDLVFAVTAIPATLGVEALDAPAIAAALVLFFVSLGVWTWTFVVALSRSARGDDIVVANLFGTIGGASGAVRRHLFGALGVCLVITVVTAAADPFGVLVPMLPLGFVGLWAAPVRHLPAAPLARTAASLSGPSPSVTVRLRAARRVDSMGSMADEAHEHTLVAATPGKCWGVATDYESYPEWARDVKHVALLERDEQGRGAKVEYRVAGLGRSIRYVLEYDYSEAPDAFSWHLVEGDVLRRLDGRYGFEPDGDGTRGHVRPGGRHLDPAARHAQAPGSRDDHGHRAAGAQEGGGEMTEPVRDDVPGGPDPSAAEEHRHDPDGPGPGMPPPTATESLVGALLEAGPEVAEHVVRAAQELLLAAQTIVDAAEQAVQEQQAVRDQARADGARRGAG